METGNRKIMIYVRHCGVDVGFIKEILNSEKFKNEYDKVKKLVKEKCVIGSIDRRSPLSGVVEKFVGYKCFLERFPDFIKKSILIQV